MMESPALYSPGEQTVLLTFDYEMFFVGAATVDRCLIQPADAILKTLEAAGVKACFFVDGPMLLAMADEPRAENDLHRVLDQIGRMLSAGHRVEVHVHPQWLDAVWTDGRWDFPVKRSLVLADLGEARAVDLIATGAQALLAAAREARPDYELQAFRAPGLCAQPFHVIKAGMTAAGLTIDSSVAPGMARHTDVHSFDYREAPRDPCWRFDDDPMQAVTGGRLAELPVTCVPIGLPDRVVKRLDRGLHPHSHDWFGDGTWQMASEPMRKKLVTTLSIVTLETTPPQVLRSMLARAGRVVTVLSHPKAMAPVSMRSLAWLTQQDVRFALPAEVVAAAEDAC